MPQVIQNLADHAQLVPIVGCQPPEREDLPVRPARKQHQQQDGKQKARDRIGHNDHARGPCVEFGAVPDRLANAQRDRDQIGDDRGPQPQRDGHGQLFGHQRQHGFRPEIALPEIEAQVVPHHQEKPFHRRFVEAKLALQLLDELLGQALGTLVAAIAFLDLQVRLIHPAIDRGKRVPLAFKIGKDLLHRAAGDKLCQGEIHQHDAD